MITIELNQKLDENGIEILVINYEEYRYDVYCLSDSNDKLIAEANIAEGTVLEELSIDNTGSTTVISFENTPLTDGYTHMQIKSFDTLNNNELVRASKWIPIASLLEDYTNPVSFNDDNSLILFDVYVGGSFNPNYPDDFDEGTDEATELSGKMQTGGGIQSLTELPNSSIDIENVSIKLSYNENEVILTTDEQGYFRYDFPASTWGDEVTAEVINPGAIGKKTEYTDDGSS